MNINKKLIGLVAAVTTVVGAVGSALPMYAQNVYTPATGGTVDVEKYLIYDSDANAPTATFNYTITAGTAIEAADGKLAVFAGDDHSVVGAPTIENASFNSNSAKYTSPQDVVTTLGKHANITKDPVTLANGEAYSRDEVTVDFTNVKFNEPGVFRWVITEQESTVASVVNDSDNTRILDVYVDHKQFDEQSAQGELEVKGYVLHNTDTFQPSSSSTPAEPGGTESTKAIGFVNRFVSYDVTLKNIVEGNQASHTKYFAYTVSLENAGASNKIDIDFINADATVPNLDTDTATKASFKGQSNPTVINTDSEGKANITVYLQHNQKIAMRGIQKNAKVTIVETAENDYITEHEASPREPGLTVTIDELTENRDVIFYNIRNGAIPTGVLTTIIPGILIVCAAAAAYFFIMKKKKEDEEDEEDSLENEKIPAAESKPEEKPAASEKAEVKQDAKAQEDSEKTDGK